MAIVELANVSKIYGKGETQVHALDGASLEVNEGEVVIIEGPSGSGKTTLISILGLLLRPTAGQVRISGTDLATASESALPAMRAKTFGFVFQGFNLFPALTALENVAIGLRMRSPNFKNPEAEARRLLDAVGLENRKSHLPADLSGGQKQRVAIARALAGGPPVIVGDEPTAALDTKTALGVMHLLRQLAVEEGRAVVIVTHDPRLQRFADRIVQVEDGRVISNTKTTTANARQAA
jgi:putative ABC transport system ATP-binding protein